MTLNFCKNWGSFGRKLVNQERFLKRFERFVGDLGRKCCCRKFLNFKFLRLWEYIFLRGVLGVIWIKFVKYCYCLSEKSLIRPRFQINLREGS